MISTLITGPALEPVTLAEIKAWARIDTTDHDTLLESLIVAARSAIEQHCGRALITQTWDVSYELFTLSLAIPFPPLQSVTSISYVDTDDTIRTLNSAGYEVETAGVFGSVNLLPGYTWPSTARRKHPITLRVVAGYGDAADDVPETIRLALKLLVGYWYDTPGGTLPESVTALLWPYRALSI